MHSEVEIFLKTREDFSISYMMAGVIDEENRFSGVVFAHSGGGDYDEEIVFRDKLMPYNEDGAKELDEKWNYENNIEKVSLLVDYPSLVKDIQFEIQGFLDGGNGEFYLPKLLRDSVDEHKNLSTKNFTAKLLDYGNIIFENEPQRWSSKEIDYMVSQKILNNLVFEKNFDTSIEVQKKYNKNKEALAMDSIGEYVTVYPYVEPRKLANAVKDKLGVDFSVQDVATIINVEEMVMNGEIQDRKIDKSYTLKDYEQMIKDNKSSKNKKGDKER